MRICVIVLLGFAPGAIPSARGCPVCDTAVGAAVRAGIFNAAFLPTLLEVVAPFAVLGPILYVLHRRLPD